MLLRGALTMSTRDRLVSLLLDLAVPWFGKLVVKKPPSQEQMATLCHASRESINRVVSKLLAEGSITRVGIGQQRRLIVLSPALERPRDSK